MNRAAEQPRRDHPPQRSREASIPPLTTRAATSSPRTDPPPQSEHTNAAAGSKSRKSARPSTKRATGKQRKRSRSEMTTSSLRDSMDDQEALALAASPAKRSRPSLTESQHIIHSDEDDEAARFSVPPPPPSEPVPAELLCRYPNKPCPQERATKKHGELHSYCAYHRFKAQQYQRKLEQKKRERRLREGRSPSALLAATTLSGGVSGSDGMLLRGLALEPGMALVHHSPPGKALSPPVRRQGVRARTRSSPPRPSGAMASGSRNQESSRTQSSRHAAHQRTAVGGATTTATLEPFHHPVSLQDGDLQLLQVFLWDSESPPKTDLSGPGQSRTAPADPRTNPASTMARNRPDGSAAYNVNLDGFTFTSESL